MPFRAISAVPPPLPGANDHAHPARPDSHRLARPRGALRDRRADSVRGRSRAQRGQAAAGGQGAAQAARDRASASARWTCRRRTAAARRASSTRSPSGSSSAASPTRSAGASPSRIAGCSRPARRQQLERFVLPLMTGKRKECYAITESGSGSDVDIETSATRHGGRLSDHRREVVRHERELRRLLHPAGEARRRSACRRARAVLHRQGRARHRARAHAAVQPHVRRSPSGLPLQRRRRAAKPAHRPRRRRHAVHAQLVPARTAHDRRALLWRRQPADRGSHRVRRDAHDRRRAAGRQADDPGDARGQRRPSSGPRGSSPTRPRTRTIAART